jgi:hypothetical protein
VPEPSAFKVEMAIEKPETYKSPGMDQIPAEPTKSGGRTIRSEIHKLINSVWSEEEWPEKWKELIIVLYLSIRRVIKQILVIIGAYHF